MKAGEKERVEMEAGECVLNVKKGYDFKNHIPFRFFPVSIPPISLSP